MQHPRRPAEEPDGHHVEGAVLVAQVSNAGAFLAGSANNGAHAANG
jgi:hypothetical protein